MRRRSKSTSLQRAQLAVAQTCVDRCPPQCAISRLERLDEPASFIGSSDPFASSGAGRQTQPARRVNEQRIIVPSQDVEGLAIAPARR